MPEGVGEGKGAGEGRGAAAAAYRSRRRGRRRGAWRWIRGGAIRARAHRVGNAAHRRRAVVACLELSKQLVAHPRRQRGGLAVLVLRQSGRQRRRRGEVGKFRPLRAEEGRRGAQLEHILHKLPLVLGRRLLAIDAHVIKAGLQHLRTSSHNPVLTSSRQPHHRIITSSRRHTTTRTPSSCHRLRTPSSPGCVTCPGFAPISVRRICGSQPRASGWASQRISALTSESACEGEGKGEGEG